MEAGGGKTPIFDRILNVGGAVAGGLLVAVMLIVCIKVFFRYFLREGLIGIDQVSGTLMVYITFIGAAWVLRREEHVTIDFLVMQLSPDTRRWLNVIVSIICAGICLVLTVFGTVAVISSWQKGILIPAEIEIPRAINLAVIPLGALLLLIQFIRRTLFFFRGGDVSRLKAQG
jgi:TRAP-type C4-dicarboxylate transport system permease small subunit